MLPKKAGKPTSHSGGQKKKYYRIHLHPIYQKSKDPLKCQPHTHTSHLTVPFPGPTATPNLTVMVWHSWQCIKTQDCIRSHSKHLKTKTNNLLLRVVLVFSSCWCHRKRIVPIMWFQSVPKHILARPNNPISFWYLSYSMLISHCRVLKLQTKSWSRIIQVSKVSSCTAGSSQRNECPADAKSSWPGRGWDNRKKAASPEDVVQAKLWAGWTTTGVKGRCWKRRSKKTRCSQLRCC